MRHTRGAPYHPMTQGKSSAGIKRSRTASCSRTIICPAISKLRSMHSSRTTTTAVKPSCWKRKDQTQDHPKPSVASPQTSRVTSTMMRQNSLLVQAASCLKISDDGQADRVRTFCGGAPQSAWARQAGDLQLPRLHLHLRQDFVREDSRSNGKPAPTACGRSCRRSSRRCDGACTSLSRTGQVAGAGCPRLLQLSRRADKWSGIGGVPASCHRPLAAHLTTSQSEGSDDVGTDDAAGG